MKKSKNKSEMKLERERSNPFKEAVECTPDIAGGYCMGLRAMGNNSKRVQIVDTELLRGSVDIDGMVKDKYPEEARWDYVIGYGQHAYFVEVHSAETSEVKMVLAKFGWLRNWLKTQAPELAKMKSSVNTFVWIPSGRVNVLPGSPQAMRLNQSGLKLMPVLKLK